MKFEFEITTEATVESTHTVEVEAPNETEALLIAKDEARKSALSGSKGVCVDGRVVSTRLVSKGAPCPKN